MLYDVCVLGAHGGPVCCHGRSTYTRGRLGSTPGFGFVQFTRYSILMIWASEGLLIISRGYQKSAYGGCATGSPRQATIGVSRLTAGCMVGRKASLLYRQLERLLRHRGGGRLPG